MRVCYFFAVLSFLTMVSIPLNAIERDTVSTNRKIREYKEEIGYFQIANRDTGDPRFMFHDDAGRIDFGIGGSVNVSPILGYGGSASDKSASFKPAALYIPQERSSLMGVKISASELHVKARSTLLGHNMIAYIKINGNASNQIVISQAYISYAGISIGKIPSFFVDREVGCMTTGIGVNGTIDRSHPLIGYTTEIGRHFIGGIALEEPSLNMEYFSEKGVNTEYQAIPDVSGYLKFKWEKGHVLISGLYRNLRYWVYKLPLQYESQGLTKVSSGFGVSLSGNFKPDERFKLSYQFTYGQGIGDYIDDISGLNLNMAMKNGLDKDGYHTMVPVRTFSAYCSGQINWNKRLSSSLLFGRTRCFQSPNASNSNDFKCSNYAAANLFWYLDDYALVGAEYIFGTKKNYQNLSVSEIESSLAHRFVLQFKYCF